MNTGTHAYFAWRRINRRGNRKNRMGEGLSSMCMMMMMIQSWNKFYGEDVSGEDKSEQPHYLSLQVPMTSVGQIFWSKLFSSCHLTRVFWNKVDGKKHWEFFIPHQFWSRNAYGSIKDQSRGLWFRAPSIHRSKDTLGLSWQRLYHIALRYSPYFI